MILSRLLYLCLALLAVSATAQRNDLKFTRLNTSHGLSQDHVMAILKDHDGFMWFATEGGLNRYDGYEFQVYRNDPDDTTSLRDNYVTDLLEDRQGNLLIGLNTGLSKFDPALNNFVHYEIKGLSVRDLYEDKQGRLWLGTNGGVFQFDLAKGITKHFSSSHSDAYSLSDNLVYEIAEDDNQNLWIATRNGLNKLTASTGQITRYFHDPSDPNSISGNLIRAVYKDSHGFIWIGTRNTGVTRIDVASNSFTRFPHDPLKNSISNDAILSFGEDDQKRIWIGTENGGIDIYDPATQTFTNYTTVKGDPRSLSNGSIYCLYPDKTSGDMWIGTYSGGVNLVPRFGDKFNHYEHNLFDKNSLTSSNVLSLNGDNDGNIWIGTDGAGLNLFNPEAESFKHFVHNEKVKNSLSSNYIFSITPFDDQTLILTYLRAGFEFFDKRTGKCRRPPDLMVGSANLYSTSILVSFKDDDEHVWLGTASNGLIRYNVKNHLIKHYLPIPGDPTSIGGDAVTSIMRDNFGNLWFGTTGGLSLYNREKDNFIRYQSNKDDKGSITNSSVYCIFQDSRNDLWIGTANGGLNLYDYQTKKFTSITEKDGLANNTIFGIEEDEKGNLWLSTNKGLTKLDPRTRIARNFDSHDGVQGNQFRFNASYKTRDGQMFFGGTNGFNAFYPHEVVYNTVVPPVKLTGFSIFNRSVSISDPDSPLSAPITKTKEITLPYNVSVFTFKFAALNYTVPQKNQYAYMLEGFDKEWNYIGTNRSVTYTNLDPGKYTFFVNASNNDGVWNEHGTSIQVYITPPFWKTWWFKMLMGLSVFAILGGIYQLRVGQIKKQKTELEVLVTERTKEILSQKEEIESQKESIAEKNAMLENQYQEIAAQNEQITIQNRRLEEARNEIKLKNIALQQYNEELESKVKSKTSQLEKAFDTLKESNRELDQFIYRSAHDLKGPIASILGLCNLGVMETTDPQMLKLLEKMGQSAGQMTKKLSRLMRIHEINTLEAVSATVVLEELTEEVIQEIQSEIDCDGVEMNITSKNTTIVSDRELIRILLKNVIENSVKFKDGKKKNPYVRINMIHESDYAAISIIDNGIGIPKQEAERIFDLFVVATDHISGFGIGLYEAKITARKLGGNIQLNFPPSGETEFVIEIKPTEVIDVS